MANLGLEIIKELARKNIAVTMTCWIDPATKNEHFMLYAHSNRYTGICWEGTWEDIVNKMQAYDFEKYKKGERINECA